MKRTALSFLLALVLLTTPLLGAHKTPSILPLSNGTVNYCTAFSINEEVGLWMTARHCVSEETAYLDGKVAVLAYVAPDQDIALYRSETTAPSLRLSKQTPRVGDALSVVGHPFGMPVLATQKGYLAARGLIMPNGQLSDVLDLAVAPGNSGSPVLNAKGEVVGLLWGSFVEKPLSLDVPVEVLRMYTWWYWER